VLSSSDAVALASLGSACCVVVQQGVTPINSVRLALDEIKHLPMLGVVLNQVRINTPNWVRNFLPQE
jgi:Mrp family chromosome partitioning ATPase